ncbi:leucine-rich repeat-containing protein 56 [Pelodytes ibericus]
MFHIDKASDVRPGTSRVRVTDFGWQGLLNPNPLNQEDDDVLMDEYLSTTKLRALTGVEDLREVKTLQMCVDTREHTLGNFGEGYFLGNYMPNLKQLKLNNSLILSVRDLGTSLSNLEVLWMSRCGLTDLDGISSLCSLKELYLAYNDVSDLSQVSMLEHLEILDLEGNNLEHISELQYLALCMNLTTLTLEGNPICVRPSSEATESSDYNYRSVVRNIIPHLHILDDVPADHLNTDTTNTPSHDWHMVKDYIKDQTASPRDAGAGRWSLLRKTNMRPSTAQPAVLRRPSSAPRPTTAGRPVTSLQRPGGSLLSEPTEECTAENEASDLTHGAGRVICGNPIKALRERKEKLGMVPKISLGQFGHKSEHLNDTEVTLDKDRDDVFAELRSWREKHHVALQRIQADHAPQVLTINHSDEEDEACSASDEEEELKEPWDLTCLVRVTPDISSPSPRSPTGSLYSGEMTSTDVKCVPSPPMTPSPPASGSVNYRPNKGADIRVRRILRGANQGGARGPGQVATDACMGDEAFPLVESEGKNPRILFALKPHESRSSDLDMGPSTGGAQTRSNSARLPFPKQIHFHQPVIRSSTKTPETPSPPQITRSVAAKEILHRLPNRPTLLTGNKRPNT